MTVSRHLWARDLCDALLAPGTSFNARALVAQAQAEGGDAHFNPLNTTLELAGATAFNTIRLAGAATIHVWNYATYEDGIEATRRTLMQANFSVLLHALRDGTSASAYWGGLAVSPWGTKPPGGLSIASWLADVDRHWFDYALRPIPGT